MTDAGDLLRTARTRAGLTQAELAHRAATSQAAVARYESGDVSPVVSTLQRLLAAAGCRLELAVGSLPSAAFDLVMEHRERIVVLARSHGVENVRLFGSAARGEDDADSDIDLLVDFDTSAGLLPIMELADELETLLGRPVDVAPVSLLRADVAERALNEAVTL